MNINTTNIDEQSEVLKHCLIDPCRAVLRVSKNKKEGWMNDVIMNMMEHHNYKEISDGIRTKTRDAK